MTDTSKLPRTPADRIRNYRRAIRQLQRAYDLLGGAWAMQSLHRRNEREVYETMRAADQIVIKSLKADVAELHMELDALRGQPVLSDTGRDAANGN